MQMQWGHPKLLGAGEERSGAIMKVFEDGSLSFTCDGGEQSEGETEKEFVKDLKERKTCEYRFYKTLY